MPDLVLSPGVALVASLACYDATGNPAPAPTVPVWGTDTPELVSIVPSADGTAILRGLSTGSARVTASSGTLAAAATVPVTSGAAVRAEIVLSPFAPPIAEQVANSWSYWPTPPWIAAWQTRPPRAEAAAAVRTSG